MKYKRIIAMLVVCVLFITTMGSVYAVGEDAGAFLNQTAANVILDEFDKEITFIEQRQGVSISQINGTTLAAIQAEVNKNLSNSAFRFAEMMDNIAVFFAKQEAAMQIQPYTNNEVIRNMVTTTYRSYRALKGAYKTRVSKDAATTNSGTLNMGISGSIEGITLSVGATFSTSYTVSGPKNGDTLFNGKPATHNYLCGVLYGTILKTEWDIYNKRTNQFISHHVSYVVQDSTANVTPYTCRAYIPSSGTLYIDSADPAYKRTATWSNHPAFTAKIAQNPQLLLKGLTN